jgi:YfiH family protein
MVKNALPAGFKIVKKKGLSLIYCEAISKIPGFTQVFTTRAGGVSKKPFDSLNVGMHTGDNLKKTVINISRLEKSLAIKYAGAASQVHGSDIIILKNRPKRLSVAEIRKMTDVDADALITDIPGLAVGVRLADCVGTVIIDPVKKTVAAVHSGWRGIANKIPAKTVKMMKKYFGSKPDDLIASVSPAIGPCCYEIGADVLKLKKQKVFSGVFTEKSGRNYMNLWKSVKNLLVKEGVKPNNIHICSMCTFDNPELFYSHRRDSGKTGRMMALGFYRKKQE